MSLVECPNCGRAVESRSMHSCPSCGEIMCADCARSGNGYCPNCFGGPGDGSSLDG